MNVRATRTNAAGFSLVELMVSVTIGLLIVAAMSGMYAASSSGKKTGARFAEYQTNARYALDVLRRDIQLSGFYGVTYVGPDNPNDPYDEYDRPSGSYPITLGSLGSIANDCGTGTASIANLAQPVFGTSDSNPYAATCIATANYARGDILVLRRAGPDFTIVPAAGKVQLGSVFSEGRVFVGNSPPSLSRSSYNGASDDIPLYYPVNGSVYYVSPWTSSPTESPRVPALYRLVLGSGPAVTAELVASNVENLKVQYGLANSTGTQIRFYNASEITNWTDASVVAVRLFLLARSSDVDPGYRNASTYSMGSASVTVDDGYQRQLFQQVVQVRQ
jgi:type IV pilus assembly protein PilW